MRRRVVDRRSHGHDTARVEGTMTAVIVPLDVLEVHGPGDAGHLIEAARVGPQVRVVDDAPDVALEMTEIDASNLINVVNKRQSASVSRSPTRKGRAESRSSIPPSVSNSGPTASS